MTARLVNLLIAARWPLLVAAIALAALAYGPAGQVRFDHSVERMFAPNDPLLPPYERLKTRFGANEVVLAVYHDPELLKPDGRGLARLAEISGQLKKVAGVRDVLSLSQVNDLLAKLQQGKALFNLFGKKPKDEWQGPPILDPKSPLAERYRELFAGYTHSADGQTAAIACLLQPVAAKAESADAPPRASTIEGLEAIIQKLPGGLAPGVLAGEPVMVAQGFELLEQDGRSLGIWSTLLLGLTILLCFRSLRWLLLPIAVVQWSILITRALLVLSGLELSMVSSMLTAIITVVGVATVIHLIVRFRELRTEGLAPRSPATGRRATGLAHRWGPGNRRRRFRLAVVGQGGARPGFWHDDGPRVDRRPAGNLPARARHGFDRRATAGRLSPAGARSGSGAG